MLSIRYFLPCLPLRRRRRRRIHFLSLLDGRRKKPRLAARGQGRLPGFDIVRGGGKWGRERVTSTHSTSSRWLPAVPSFLSLVSSKPTGCISTFPAGAVKEHWESDGCYSDRHLFPPRGPVEGLCWPRESSPEYTPVLIGTCSGLRSTGHETEGQSVWLCVSVIER